MNVIKNPESIQDFCSKNLPTAAIFVLSYCPFYKVFRPYFEDFAKKNQKKYEYLTVFLDDFANPLWSKYNLKVSPTIIVFQGDKILQRIDGILGHGLDAQCLQKL
jgi:hypothetical protein